MRIEVSDYIVIDSDICHGKPTFKDTRIMVWQILELLETRSMKEVLDSFPSLKKEHIRAALSYAANITSGNNVSIRA
ncbi:DUF433 domain-containing protein [archaeon]|nr:DUF433 domain-containing protein [archaeon]